MFDKMVFEELLNIEYPFIMQTSLVTSVIVCDQIDYNIAHTSRYFFRRCFRKTSKKSASTSYQKSLRII